MVWVILGPLAPFLRQQFGLSATAQGLLVAVPLLGGSLFRPVLGVLADRVGGRRAGLIGLALTVAALVAGWTVATAPWHLFVLAFFLGIAGASFAVALPLASRWYPPEYQGLAMGIVGAGNSGSLMATLFAPRLAERIGWANTLGLALMPVVCIAILFASPAKDSPARPAATSWSDYVAVLREPDTLWFSFLYSLTFGGFVGFTSFLTTFFHEQYHVSRVSAGDFTTIVVVSGSLMRPLGGWLSDRLGGYRLLLVLLAGAAISLSAVADAAAAVCRRAAAVRDRRAARHGQRRGLPARAAALRRAHGHRDRHRRRRRAGSAGSSCRPCWAPPRMRPAATRSACLLCARRSWSVRSSCSSWAPAGRCAGSHKRSSAPESSVIAERVRSRAASLTKRTGPQRHGEHRVSSPT